MFSLTIEYAMRAVLALASGDGSPMTTKSIATMMKVPQSYLSKVLQSLVRGGLVFSTRGLNGGFVLSRPPAEISMLDIMNACRGRKLVNIGVGEFSKFLPDTNQRSRINIGLRDHAIVWRSNSIFCKGFFHALHLVK